MRLISLLLLLASSTFAQLRITSSDVKAATAGAVYSDTLSATGGTTPYTWTLTAGSLPVGITLSSVGVLSGTPSSVGWSGLVTVQVTDNVGATATRPLSMLVAPVFDTYYGFSGQPCPSGSTGRYYVQKIGSRWWMCTPSGNKTFINAVGAIGDPAGVTGTVDGITSTLSTIVTTKYGDANYLWGAQSNRRLLDWGFNSIGQDSASWVQPTATCSGCGWPGGVQPVKLPEFTGTYESASYAMANLWGYAGQAIKNITNATNLSIYTQWPAGIVDAFDPSFPTWTNSYYNTTNQPGFSQVFGQPYSFGMLIDDSDFFWGMGAGPDFYTIPYGQSGHTNSHIGYRIAIASPVVTLEDGRSFAQYGERGELFPDSKVYSKVAMASPPTTCTMTTPCSLRDFLFKKYSGSISALNTAWGSSYTTFDSAGTQVNNELVVTGDGSTTSFTFTLAHSSVSPLSFSLSTTTGLLAGDCAWWKTSCGTAIAHHGVITNPGIQVQTGTNYYSNADWVVDSNGYLQEVTTGGYSGATLPTWNTTIGGTTSMGTGPTSVIFTNQGPSISGVGASSPSIADPSSTGGSGLPTASYWCIATWHGVVSGTGNEVGITVPANTAVKCGPPENTPPAGATGWDVYVSCMNQIPVGSGGVTWCNTPGVVGNSQETLQSSNIALGSAWTEPNTGLVSGAALPSLPFINYTTGAVTVKFAVAPATGVHIYANYVYGGWGYGTGLMDEDGRNTSWIGTNPFCLITRAGGAQPGDRSYSCDGTLNPVANANQNLAADLDLYIAQFSAEYFKTVSAAIHTADPSMLYMGADTVGTFGVPADRYILQAAGQYVDMLFINAFPDTPDHPTYVATLNYTHQYLGDKPLMEFLLSHATKDSATFNFAPSGVVQANTQEERGADYVSWMNGFINTSMSDGTFPFVGNSWWAFYDFFQNGETANWGMVSINDNAYDGRASCQATGTDEFGYSTGGETVIPSWQLATAYNVPPLSPPYGATSDMVQASVTGTIYVFRPTVAGTSGSTAPTWPTTLNATVTDGGVTWQNVGTKGQATCFGDVIDPVKQANTLWFSAAQGGFQPSAVSGHAILTNGAATH